MASAKGLREYTTQEAFNASLGQVSTVLIKSSSAFSPKADSGLKILAIHVVSSTPLKLTSLDSEDNDTWMNTSSATEHTGDGAVLPADEFAEGLILYGRWNSVEISQGVAILYLG